MTTWTELFPDLDEPVRGRPDEYAAATAHAAELRGSMLVCSSGFAAVAEGASPQLVGASALAVADVLAGIDRSLHSLPDVFDRLAALFSDHAGQLDSLHVASVTALARGAERLAMLHLAERDRSRAEAALAALDAQLRAARGAAAAGDADATARVPALEQRRWSARGRCSDAEHAESVARSELARSRDEHAQLAGDEQRLRAATWAQLRELELGDLADPSGLLHAVGAMAGWAWDHTGGALIEVTASLADAVVAFADGRFFDALHHLSDAVDAATDLLTGITVIVVVAGLTVCPGALAALPALVAVGQALGETDLALTGVLALSQTAHPETGETVGVVDLVATAAAHAAGSALAGSGARVAGTGRAQAAALSQAGAGAHARREFVRTAAENRSVVDAAAAGASRIVNPATGATVAGAAKDALVRRASLELGADQTLQQLTTVIDAAIANELADDLAAPQVATFETALSAVHPDAAEALDRHVLGALAVQTRAVADVWRGGLSARHPYLIVSA